MTIRCPRCQTEYRLPPRSRLDPRAPYRCARCGHVFQTDAEVEEPSLIAEDDEPAVQRPTAFDEEPDETLMFDDETEPEVEPDPPPLARREPPTRGVSPARFAVRALLIVTLAYGVVSIYVYTHPETVRALLAQVPVVGTRLSENALNPASIQLTDVRGQYLRVQGDQLVFVVSGVAINNSPVPVNGIQVEGRIVGARDERQVVFCGTAPRDPQALSVREIALLQTLEPPKDWSLGPGEQTTCTVVFVGPPSDLREFSAEVVVVQGKRHHRHVTAS